uniref:Uncharacterized protein n=1 Tax=Brassica oleracea var. oleracea TaxID=109376 RepID=A0A0D2ZQC7_BRAOL
MGGLSLEAPVRLSHAESWREGAVIHCRGGPNPWNPYVEHTRAGGSMRTQQERAPCPGTPVGNGGGAGVTIGIRTRLRRNGGFGHSTGRFNTTPTSPSHVVPGKHGDKDWTQSRGRIALGASSSVSTIKPFIGAITIHQLLEGFRPRRCISKAKFELKKILIMAIRSSADTKTERSRQRSLSVAKAKSLGGRSLKHPGSASMASLGEIEYARHRYVVLCLALSHGLYTQDRESNDLVNHIGGVFRYFIVDVLDHGSTPDVARCGRELGLRVTHKIRWWKAASIRKKGFRAVLDLQSQGVCDYMHWSLGFLHVLQVTGTESIVEHKGWYSLVSVNGVAEGLKEIDSCYKSLQLGRCSENKILQGCYFQRECSVVFLSRYVFGVTHSFLLEWICENEELLIQGRVQLNEWRCQIEIDSGWKHRFFGSKVFLASCAKRRDLLATAAVQSDVQGKAVVIQVLQELQVSIDISWKFWRRRIYRFVVTITTTTTSETEEQTFTEDDLKAVMVSDVCKKGKTRVSSSKNSCTGYRKGRQTHIKSKLDLRRWNQRSSIPQGLKVFSEITRNAEETRAREKCVKSDTSICWSKWLFVVTACSSFSEVLRVTRKVSGCKKKARIVTKRNRVEQVATTGCNPEDKGYETTVINTCSRSRKSLPQLVEACIPGGVSHWFRRCLDWFSCRGVRAERKGYSITTGSWICSVCQSQECQGNIDVVSSGKSISKWLNTHRWPGGVSCLSVQRYKVMLKCSLFKNIKVKSKTVPEIWSMSDFKGLYTQDRESNYLVNHIGGGFRYFIVDVVDHGSTPDVARCGRELGEQFLSHEQG